MSKTLKAMMQDELKTRFDGVDGGVFAASSGVVVSGRRDAKAALPVPSSTTPR